MQGLDRYAYVNNAPVRYTDPSGHRCVPEEECENNAGNPNAAFDLKYGITFSGDWTDDYKDIVRDAVRAVANAFLQEYRRYCRSTFGECDVLAAWELFRDVYNTTASDRIVFQWGNCSECNGAGGYTYGSHHIAFASLPKSFYPSGIKTPEMAYRQGVNNVVHELGHAFALLWANGGGYDNSGPYGTGQIPGDMVDNDGFYLYPQPDGASLTWRQHPCTTGEDNCSHEVFADMFLGWTYGKWAPNAGGADRAAFMNQHMSAWIVNLVSP